MATIVAVLFFVCTAYSQPVISSFAPKSGIIGSTTVISGNNFSPVAADNIVYVGGIRAQIVSATSTALAVIVPVGAASGNISVTVNNLTVSSLQPFAVTFPGASPSFSAGSIGYGGRLDSVDSGIETTKYSTADFDNDGKMDIVTIDRLNGTFSIYLNTSAGGQSSFAPKLDFVTAASPRSVSAGDIDGDGWMDVVVTNFTTASVSVFRNITVSGVVTFAPRVDFATSFQPAAIAIGDLDRDGRPDLVINTVNVNGYVSILRNSTVNSVINFDTKLDLTSLGGSIENIAIADLDADGRIDICLPNYALNSISVFRNQTTGAAISFAPKQDFATGSYPHHIAVGDLNNDNKPEIIVSYYQTFFAVSVLRNTSTVGTVAFSPAVHHLTGVLPFGVAVHDLDGDAKPDVAVGCWADSTILMKNISPAGGNISFEPFVRTAPGGLEPLLIADFDSDSKPDIASKRGVFRVVILKNRVTEPYIKWFSPAVASTNTTVTIEGVNFAGATKVAFGGTEATSFTIVSPSRITSVVGSGASGDVTIESPRGLAVKPGFTFVPPPVINTFQPGTVTSGTVVTITGSNFTAVSAVTFGGLNAQSFTVVNSSTITAVVGNGSSGVVAVTTPGGTGSKSGLLFIPPVGISSFSPTSAGPSSIVTINGTNFIGVTSVKFGGIEAQSFVVNSSSLITAVVGPGKTGDLTVTHSVSTGTKVGFQFTPAAPPVIQSFTPTSGNAGTTVVLSGTGFDPVAVNNIVYFGATRAFVSSATSTQLSVIVPKGATYVPINVYNKKTYLNGSSSNPFLLTFPGGAGPFNSFSFASKQDIDLASGATTLSDLDGDGKSDIITGARNQGLTILHNLSTVDNLSFAPRMTFFTISDPTYGVAAADMDGDGSPDVIAVDQIPTPGGLSEFVVLRNLSVPGAISFAPDFGVRTGVGTSGLAVGDLDNDGKTDVVVANTMEDAIAIYRNVGTVGALAFEQPVAYGGGSRPVSIAIADLDGDNNKDIIISSTGQLLVLRKIPQSPGSFSGSSFQTIQVHAGNFGYVTTGDLNGDNKLDIIMSTNAPYTARLTVLPNKSTPGNILFDIPQNFPSVGSPLLVQVNDLNGDGKPDIAVTSTVNGSVVSVYRNTSSGSVITLDPYFPYPSTSRGLALGDLNGDNKPEIAVSSSGSQITVFKNQVDSFITAPVCYGRDTSITTGLTGAVYQWQVDPGSGYVNAFNGVHINNVNGPVLQLLSVPAAFHNYKYRCIVDGVVSRALVLTVNQAPPIPAITAAGSTTVCEGTPVVLTASSAGCADCNYTWSNGTTQPVNTVHSSGLYSVVATNVCGVSTASQQVTIKPMPVLAISVPDTLLCLGSSIQMTATGANQYHWSPSTGLNAFFVATVTATPTVTTTYTVLGTTNGCSVSKTVTISVAPIAGAASISISMSCTANAAVFTSQITNGGISPAIKWYVNLTQAGTGSTFTLNNPAIGTQVSAQLISSQKCLTTSMALSNLITVNCTSTYLPEIEGVLGYKLSPNPTSGLFNISFNLTKIKSVTYAVYDFAGREIIMSEESKRFGPIQKTFDLTGQPAGIYVLRIGIGNNIVTEKILIAR